ncbi:helix-hairpin-helix domain-containing protein [Anaerocolumna xylanovorans]|uniref:Competence protein ComEA n=1 Tax=Anaerocolumna xylanovorans DSM 12503 TaxID=1121345 RepID=A0A1M7YF54_9FIRM|nr:helix-hairpin-helix domain-containing protein [Anaerocolumna xylanovorans]SHO51275.1 competence protein ComEA [Anaerocolumna xylanovorans DSM 12503]
MKKYKYLKAGLIAVFLVLTGIIYSCQRNGKEQLDSTLGTPLTAEETKQTDAPTNLPEDTDKEKEEITGTPKEEKCYVHICGEVKKPGVYEVSKEARIFEIVDLAGGFTKEADKDYINQAASIEDGQQIYIPAKEEVLKGEKAKAADSGKNPGSGQTRDNTGNSGKINININTAAKEELCSLPGIGEAKADSIIDYRTNHGRFQSIEELKEIDGIKDGVYNKIKDRIISE